MTVSPDLVALDAALRSLAEGFRHLPGLPSTDLDSSQPALLAAAERMRDNYPYHHPLYAGQMLKPPHPVARLAYALAMTLNPNNHALDGGRASSAMEKEARRRDRPHVRLRRAISRPSLRRRDDGELRGTVDRRELAARQGHRGVESGALHARAPAAGPGLALRAIAVDDRGRMDVAALARRTRAAATWGRWSRRSARRRPARSIRCPRSSTCARSTSVRVHVDAAYGGYFTPALEPRPRSARGLRRDRATPIRS